MDNTKQSGAAFVAIGTVFMAAVNVGVGAAFLAIGAALIAQAKKAEISSEKGEDKGQ